METILATNISKSTLSPAFRLLRILVNPVLADFALKSYLGVQIFEERYLCANWRRAVLKSTLHLNGLIHLAEKTDPLKILCKVYYTPWVFYLVPIYI